MLQGDTSDQADQLAELTGPAGDRTARVQSWHLNLSSDDRVALGLWGAVHVALLVLAWAAAWTFRTQTSHAPLTGGFEHWDAFLFRNIAQYGYFSPHSIPHNVAFFPGYPAALAAVHLVLRNWVLSELVLSGIAGCFVVVSLSRLARGHRAVLYMLTTPAAIFLLVGYTECLYLAFAIPAWHAATRGRWWSAALLAGISGLVRPDALFLIPALAVMALAGPRGSRLANAAKACLGLLGPAAYEIYLIVQTGNWRAWPDAIQAGWDLHRVTPIQALKTTWWAAFRHPFSAAYGFEFQLELAVMAAMLLATLAFLWWRHWPEAVYCGLAVIALGTQTWYQDFPATLLVMFPVWIALAGFEARRPWFRYAYFGVSAPLAVVLGLLFLAGQWAG